MIISILSSLKIQQDELAILKSAFHKIDSNQDGTLSIDELKEGLDQLQLFEMLQGGGGTDEENYKTLMKNIDLDGDGRIDYLEFIQAAINHQALLNKDNILTIFNMFDTNGDGIICKCEL